MVVLVVSAGLCFLVVGLTGTYLAVLAANDAEKVGRAELKNTERRLEECLRVFARDFADRGAEPATEVSGGTTTRPEEVSPEACRLTHLRLGFPTGHPRRWLDVWLSVGLDGLDLPRSPLVARGVGVGGGRGGPAVLNVPSGLSAFLRVGPLGVAASEDPGFPWKQLEKPWRLDEGTRLRLEAEEEVVGRGVVTCSSSNWRDRLRETGPGSPCLLVSLEESALDLSGLGEVYGVIVADGDVLLEDTTVHGAVYTAGMVHFGARGLLVYHPEVRHFATDAVLVRRRVVPGTWRLEGTGAPEHRCPGDELSS
ncbi:MAG: hypothetical protein Kow00129_11410 [Thermoleophilia bacterium]